ncbi:MAG: alpha-galactosidase [Lachnospiraceae bacterium]|nr:alpha-galactosidase [Lachnospiraceae bacterium]
MIKVLGKKDAFILSTSHTTYCFRVTDTLHLEHLYYGASLGDAEKLDENDILTMAEKKEFEEGNMVVYDADHKNCTLENMCLEMSSYGKGDIREPFIEVTHNDGSTTCDFLFEKAEITGTKEAFATLPGSYFTEEKSGETASADAAASMSHLTVTLKDKQYDLTLELHYYVYEDCDVICRSAKLLNHGKHAVKIGRLMSSQLDFDDAGYIVRTFTGAWAREMQRSDTPLNAGTFVNSSFTGSSSNRANPFVMLHRPETSEKSGLCYGLNLVYSGNHYECAQVNAYGKTRVVTGINPQNFSFVLRPEEAFEAPEAVLTCSDQGYSGVSHQMHAFVREHIVRGKWKHKPRPVLLNSWEAAYFDINENKLIKLAKAAKEVGVELFVMDDGWFGRRNDDAHSLGDWQENEKKLPSGLSGLAKAINNLGLDFGIWVEPEMISVNSELYEKHPDWAMAVPGKPHSEGRNQRILDLCNPDVCEYVIESMEKVFRSAHISYVKWDMNRIFSDIYSPYLAKHALEGADQNDGSVQGETAHRYMMGLYRIAKTLTEEFPDILFEGCAAGGNRFDLGIMCYFPQIWGSDNTDAICRAHIQEGISYGYPMSAVSAHLSSCPNHQTLRDVGMDTRFAVALFGIFGLECNLSDMKKDTLEELAAMIALYKEWRDVLQGGDFYRGRSGGNIHEWTCVSKDQKKAVGMLLQEMVTPNMQFEKYTASGLNPEYKYHFYNITRKYDIRKFGDLINTAAPIHVKQDSVLHNVIAKFVTMPGESEDTVTSGQVLMTAGIKLKPAYSGTGYNENTRYFQDFCSRLYFMEVVDNETKL